MANIELVEYHHESGITYSSVGCGTFIFDPDPKSLKKSVEVKWRIRRAGYEMKVERARFRFNEKIEYTLVGSCTGSKRDELEWYSKRDSIFKLVNCVLKTYHSEQTDDEPAGTPPTWEAAQSQGEEFVYVIISKTEFTQKEAKTDWYDYSVELRRVSLTRH